MAALVESGDVKFTYKHLLVVGDTVRSLWAAEAAECAADQGRFWAFHEQLLRDQKQRTKAELKTLGAQVGVADTAAFNQCIDKGTHNSAVTKQSKEGRSLGIQGTPTFFVNGKQIQLQRSYDEVIDAVKKELNK